MIEFNEIEKIYEIKFLKGSSLCIASCTLGILTSVIEQLVSEGNTIIKVEMT